MMEDSIKADSSTDENYNTPSLLLTKLKNKISTSVQNKVDSILKDVQQFTDNDKLYLYLQLPSGPGAGEKSSNDSNSVNTADQLHTCNWIRSHLEEHADTCLPKQDVYETYRKHCENLQQRPLSAASFGKIIRDIFPNVKARRLGGRGQSKYCYSGIRRKTVLNMPLLPNLDLKNDPSELTELVQTYEQEVTEAACELICDWAQKILKRSFDTVVEIARFLVQEHIVNPRCSQAELLTSAALAGGTSKPHKVIKKIMTQNRGSTTEEPNSNQDAKKSSVGGEPALSVKLPPADKSTKVQESIRAGGREQQMEALMKKLPQLLPRGSLPDKAHISPPGFSPNDSSGVKVTLPIAVATLPNQQVMILPPALTVSAPTTASKRVSDAPSAVLTPPIKRKRGRPRKSRQDEAPRAGSVMLGRSVIQKALPSSSALPANPGGKPEPPPVLFLQEPGRTMVIQRTPILHENRPINPPLVTQSTAPQLFPPIIHEETEEVEITLTPIQPSTIIPRRAMYPTSEESPQHDAP